MLYLKLMLRADVCCMQETIRINLLNRLQEFFEENGKYLSRNGADE
jgi:hypothetical protein